MERVKGISKIEESLNGSVVTIGNFDGLHLGHMALIRKCVELGKEYSVPSIVMSFKPHPMKVLFPEKELNRLFDFKDQEIQLGAMGVDYFVLQPFSRELSELSAERFLSELVLKPLNPKALVVGYDFAFGANREGSISYLEKYCEKNDIALHVQSPIRVDGDIVSSTLLRKLIGEGKISFASKCMGRNFYLDGVVERGAGRGRQIGFPTANVFTKAETFPGLGVYASITHIQSKAYASVTNVGINPTFEEETRRPIQVEAHILDFDQDIYGDNIRVEFVEFLRAEKKFGSIEDLVAQIKLDLEKARLVHGKMGTHI